MAAGASPSVMGVMSNAELTAAVLDLGKMVAEIHAFLLGPQGPQPNPTPPPTPQQLPPPPPQSSAAPYPYGMPSDDTASTTTPAPSVPPGGVPIQQIPFPHSPSPLPPWLTASSTPIYSTAPARTSIPAPDITSGLGHGGVPASGTLYGGVDGSLFHGSSLWPAHTVPPAPAAFGSTDFQPKGYKLDFTTYDGSADPLN